MPNIPLHVDREALILLRFAQTPRNLAAPAEMFDRRAGGATVESDFSHFPQRYPASTRVPAAVFKDPSGGTSCWKEALNDVNTTADNVAACLS